MSLQDGLMQLGVHSGPAMEAHAKLRVEPSWREGVRVVRQVSEVATTNWHYLALIVSIGPIQKVWEFFLVLRIS